LHYLVTIKAISCIDLYSSLKRLEFAKVNTLLSQLEVKNAETLKGLLTRLLS